MCGIFAIIRPEIALRNAVLGLVLCSFASARRLDRADLSQTACFPCFHASSPCPHFQPCLRQGFIASGIGMNVVEDDDAIRLEPTEVLDQTSASTRDPQPHPVGVIFPFAQATEDFRGILSCSVADNGVNGGCGLPSTRFSDRHPREYPCRHQDSCVFSDCTILDTSKDQGSCDCMICGIIV